MPEQQLAHYGLKTADLQLDVEECTGREAGKNVLQRRYREFSRRRTGYLPPAQPGIVTNHTLPIGAETQVELETVAAIAKAKLKCFEGIFLGVATIATMSEQ